LENYPQITQISQITDFLLFAFYADHPADSETIGEHPEARGAI
jgi:hypothetical protein